MALRSAEWCVCDECDADGPRVPAGSLSGAARAAEKRGWRTVPLDRYGGHAHFCRACSAGKSDADLLAVLGLLPPGEDDPGEG